MDVWVQQRRDKKSRSGDSDGEQGIQRVESWSNWL